jgi:UDP-N-acetylmuramate dehydrogenase
VRELQNKAVAAGFSGELKLDEQLSGHTSLRVGGPASLVALPAGVEDLILLIEVMEESGVPWIVLGGGTNVIFTNGGYHGCIVKLPVASEELGSVRIDGQYLVAGAAAPLPSVVSRAAREGLAGMECLAGIPGTVGGALRMNAGTRSGQISDVVEKVWLLEKTGGNTQVRWVDCSEIGFAYRESGLAAGQVVLAVRFRLEMDRSEAILARMKKQLAARRESQPYGEMSAGCWFRNPEGDSAGRLIDEAGMKGLTCGGARVSTVHANFLVNTGSATAADLFELANKVREGVRKKFGIELEEEVMVIDG